MRTKAQSKAVACAVFVAAFGGPSAGEAPPPKLIVQDGHSGAVRTVALSPDGKHVLTGSNDKTAKVDVFAYDLDEPDVIAAICQMGKQGRLRAILDNASLHTKAGAAEIQANVIARRLLEDRAN